VDLSLGLGDASVAIFVRAPTDAAKVASALRKTLGAGHENRVGLLTGTLRGFERQALADSPVWERFLPERDRDATASSSFLVMTSAGEVGVDLDADHCVMDATTLDSFIQRVGRVNRRGDGIAEVHLVHTKAERTGPEKAKAANDVRGVAVANCMETLAALPDVSPGILRTLDAERMAASSVPAAIPVPLRREVVETLSVTSMRLPLPPVEVFLRGLSVEAVETDTYLLWRWDVEALVDAGTDAAADALSFFRPSPAEIARVPTRVAQQLLDAAIKDAEHSLPLIVRDAGGKVHAQRLTPVSQVPALAYATLVIPTSAGRLDSSGLPSATATSEVKDVADDAMRRRRTMDEDGVDPDPWRDATRLIVPLAQREAQDDEGSVKRVLVYETRRSAVATDADTDLARLAVADQTVADHNRRVGRVAERIAKALNLPDEIAGALSEAGRRHDDGKARAIWQTAAGFARSSEPMAKSRSGVMNAARLSGFRHEFASVVEAERQLPTEFPERDLVLHLIAAHHGHGRPGFESPRQWDPEVPDAANRRVATDVAERFGRLQARFGPWRLAWLEALLKAADAYVSAGRDEAT
jgi:CRISPR-associated endonuclease/helicase Cas3